MCNALRGVEIAAQFENIHFDVDIKAAFPPFSYGNLMFSNEGKFDASVANQPENCSQRVIFMQSLFNQRSKNKQRPYGIDKA